MITSPDNAEPGTDAGVGSTDKVPAAGGSSSPIGRGRRRLGLPPRERDRLLNLLGWLVCLAGASVALFIDLDGPAMVHPGEASALATSRETWQWRERSAGASDRWDLENWTPVHNGQEQLEMPPGLTWLHLMGFWNLDVDQAGPDTLIFRGRVVSAVFFLVVVTAVYWSGLSIGGLLPALFAGLICAAMPGLVAYGRLASVEMPATGLVLMSVTSAIWAIRPLKLPPSLVRQALGWAISGLCLGMAILTGGLLMLLMVAVPLALILVIYPNRLSHVLGAVAATLIAGLVLTPWALHVHAVEPEAWRAWVNALRWGEGWDGGIEGMFIGERMGLFLLMLLPWTAWVIGALIQPLSTSSTGSRMRLFLGWMWFVPVALMLLLIPGRGTVGGMLLALPAAALVLGQFFRQVVLRSQEGRHLRVWRVLSWPHAAVLLGASVLLPIVALTQDRLVAGGWMIPAFMPMHWSYWVGGSVALVLLMVLSIRYILRHYPGRVVVCWSFWGILFCSLLAAPLAGGPQFRSSLPDEARSLEVLVGDRPLYFAASGQAAGSASPPAGLLFYTGRTIRVASSPEQLQEARRESELVFVLAPPGLNLGAGFELREHLAEAKVTVWRSR